MKVEMSESGEAMMRSMILLGRHLESHNCRECLARLDIFIRSISVWVNDNEMTKAVDRIDKVKAMIEKDAMEAFKPFLMG